MGHRLLWVDGGKQKGRSMPWTGRFRGVWDFSDTRPWTIALNLTSRVLSCQGARPLRKFFSLGFPADDCQFVLKRLPAVPRDLLNNNPVVALQPALRVFFDLSVVINFARRSGLVLLSYRARTQRGSVPFRPPDLSTVISLRSRASRTAPCVLNLELRRAVRVSVDRPKGSSEP